MPRGWSTPRRPSVPCRRSVPRRWSVPRTTSRDGGDGGVTRPAETGQDPAGGGPPEIVIAPARQDVRPGHGGDMILEVRELGGGDPGLQHGRAAGGGARTGPAVGRAAAAEYPGDHGRRPGGHDRD